MDAFFEAVTPLLPAVRLILVPHEAGAFEVPAEWRSRTVFTGSIVRPSPGDASIAARAHARRVVITGGGGGYPGTVDFYNLAIQAAVHARAAHPSMEILLVAGPLFTDWWHLSLADGIRVIPFDPGLSQTFASADVVLCQAGYNTVAELIALGVPSIAVPAPRDHDDQFERAIASAKSSSCFEVYSGDSPEAFGRLIVHALQRGPVSARVVQPAPGARSAAASLLNLLSDH
jgi:predicted glycosyltransferase